MKRSKPNFKLLIVCAFVFFCSSVQAQSSQDTLTYDTIKVKRSFTGYHFKYQDQDNIYYSFSQIMGVMASCPEAANTMRISQKQYRAANATAFAGGFCLGSAIGLAMVQYYYGELDTFHIVLAATSGGLGILFTGLSLHYNHKAKKNMYAAVRLFNRQVKQGMELDVGLTGNGIGLRMSF